MFMIIIFVVVILKSIVMNKVKGVIVVALILIVSAPCFGSSVAIKRKKNKWQHSMEQKISDNTENNKSECGQLFSY